MMRRRATAVAVIVATGIALAAAYFPLVFNQFQLSDDEGVFLTSLRLLLNHHGSLYSGIWADKYGPFYYLFATSIYRVIGQQPTLENGRWIVLGLTTLSAVMFAASVWRVTRSIPAALLCEVAAFLVVVRAAGSEPMHPGSLAVLLLAFVMFALASYAARPRRAHLAVLGAATAALLMTVLITGLFVVVALVTVFVAGNKNLPRRARIVVVALAAAVPIVVTIKRLSMPWAGTLALLVGATVVGISASILVDGFAWPKRALRALLIGAVAAGVLAAGFAMVTGTHVPALVNGVFIAPWRQGFEQTLPALISVSWLAIVVTVVGLYVALGTQPAASAPDAQTHLLRRRVFLALAGAVLLGFGTVGTAAGWNLGQWLPALALLPAFAFAGALPEPVRFALRSMTLVAALQVLVAYPVAGSQIAWATVAMTVPCAIAIAAGLQNTSVWKASRGPAQALLTVVLCLALVFVSGAWPPSVWRDYFANPTLDLPGAHFVRVDKDERKEIRTVTNILRAKCDAFYSVPAVNSFYLFSGIAPLSGLVADYPGALTTAQQRRLVKRLDAVSLTKHLCILRDLSRSTTVASGYGKGPLHDELSRFTRVIATAGTFSISRKNRQAIKRTRQFDQLLCYGASSNGFDPPANLTLANQIDPSGFDAKVRAVALQCNPAQLGAANAPKLNNSAAHLLCWSFGGTAAPATVLVSNRLGTGELVIKSARDLCMPSWSRATGPPRRAAAAPPGLDQLSCYRVGYVKRGARFRTPASVRVKDEFAAKPVAVIIAGPRLLCLSVERVGSGGNRSAPTSNTQYVCFAAGPTPTRTPVYDQNAFGSGTVSVGNTELLCLPSTKRVLAGPHP